MTTHDPDALREAIGRCKAWGIGAAVHVDVAEWLAVCDAAQRTAEAERERDQLLDALKYEQRRGAVVEAERDEARAHIDRLERILTNERLAFPRYFVGSVKDREGLRERIKATLRRHVAEREWLLLQDCLAALEPTQHAPFILMGGEAGWVLCRMNGPHIMEQLDCASAFAPQPTADDVVREVEKIADRGLLTFEAAERAVRAAFAAGRTHVE